MFARFRTLAGQCPARPSELPAEPIVGLPSEDHRRISNPPRTGQVVKISAAGNYSLSGPACPRGRRVLAWQYIHGRISVDGKENMLVNASILEILCKGRLMK